MDSNENLNIQDPQNPDFGEIAEIKEPRNWKLIWERIVKVGLGDVILRVGTVLASIALVLLTRQHFRITCSCCKYRHTYSNSFCHVT